MRARVGSTCIKTYGPRPAWKHNTDHDRWADEWSHARAAQAVEQVRLDADHNRALAELPHRLAAWEAELASATGIARRRRRQHAGHILWTAVGWLALVMLVP